MTLDNRLFPAGISVSEAQIELLDAFGRELRRMNQRINLVSSETESEFWKRHTAHCLALATHSFPADSSIVDWGSGGGLPAIPLAIMFPRCKVIGVDSVLKKIQSSTAVTRRLGLENCTFIHGRAENVHLEADYSVSRATAPLTTLWEWHQRVVSAEPDSHSGANKGPRIVGVTDSTDVLHPSDEWPRGLICLKGGELEDEISDLYDAAAAAGALHPTIQTIPLTDLFNEPWYQEKVILHVSDST